MDLTREHQRYEASGGRVLIAGALGRLGARGRVPPHLYARGAVALLATERPAMAIVGSREPLPWGITQARRVARDLARAGVTVVSGGARGTDRGVHEAALEAEGCTIAVLGEVASHADERPLWMRSLFDAAPGRALSVTTAAPGGGFARWRFAARNHHIAAAADAVVITEGAAGSGTRHTAAAARSLGVPLWCFFNGDSPVSAVPVALVESDRAFPLPPEGALLRLLGRAPPPAPDEPALVAAVRRAGGRLSVDDAARLLARSAREVLSEAALLEMAGQIRREGSCLVCR